MMFYGAAYKRKKLDQAQDEVKDPKKYLGVIDKKLNEDEEEER